MPRFNKKDMKKANKKLLKIIGLGIVAGMRATVSAAVISHFYSKKNKSSLTKSRLGFIQSPVAAVVTKVLTAAEIAGDKIPGGPDRIIAPQVIARVASGAFSAALLSVKKKDKMAEAMVIGGAAALAATYGFFFLRKYISEKFAVNNVAAGAVEDTIALGAAILIVK